MVNKPIPIPPAPAPAPTGILKLEGEKIVDKNGHSVILRGAAIGGWMNMENFITGYPGHETGMREALLEVLGQDKYDFFFDRFLEYFFDEKDAQFFASLGLNCLRVPFNYRHFEDDMNPSVLKERGFQWLDRIVNICGKYGIYTILDLHAAPGGQSTGWHCDSGLTRALFWEHIDFQTRAIKLWEALAARYKDNTWVAGYNPLNEPADSQKAQRLLAWYDRVNKAILAIDPNHIQFYDGNTYAADFSDFMGRPPMPNSVYAIHDYAGYGFPASHELYTGSAEQKHFLEKQFARKIAYNEEIKGHIWNGEFGPVYAREWADGPQWEEINKSRYMVLRDQLALYDTKKISWSIWLFKDIGFQGMVYASPDSPYVKTLQPFIEKKKKLAADAWGVDLTDVKEVFEPMEHWLEQNGPAIRKRYPPTWNPGRHLGRPVRNILLSESLYPEYAAYFKDLSEAELEAFAASFKFENCVQREGLNAVLREHAAIKQ
ncbi:glycoside hydrolase [Dacryopinax primogenitus]|uniref:Glycoside hydrolase n=1 Tax=Dacryopinax primogenitus (strain DJM 731) TaxID=1858805 RepID=M5FQ10_DACPD|nr:glycoside hydrolase [Dacryopinax primogenitus]EJT96664.1 glycoside hydrolase [Dacryopinax primogenitus]